jgi:acyl carrier protein phosphodiesterase
MIDYDWLRGYKHLKGIEDTFANLARRNEMRQSLQGAERSLHKNLALYEGYFFEFYPQLQQVSSEFISKN